MVTMSGGRLVALLFVGLGLLRSVECASKPSMKPSVKPSNAPSFKPSKMPTVGPSRKPTSPPTMKPSRIPSTAPTDRPTSVPTSVPTAVPTARPTGRPSSLPTHRPSAHPTTHPTAGTHGGNGEPHKKLGPASIAGIVISVFALVAFVGFYVYRTHFHYVRRFIKLHIPGGYRLLGDDDDDEAKASRNMVHDEEGGEAELRSYEVANPLVRADSVASEARGRNNSDTMESEIQAVSAQGIIKAGYLLKQTTNLQRNWVRRWFFIKDGYLYYAHKHTDVGGANTPRNKIISAVLVANLMISTIKTNSDIEFSIVSPGARGVGTGGGVYCVQAESPGEADEWVQVIRDQIEKYLCRSLPVSDKSGVAAAAAAEGSPVRSVLYENKLVGTSSELFVPSERTLQDLYKANPYCADCGKERPDWASINLCIMICIDCAGVHRKLGAHISKVRSLKLDKWSVNLISLLTNVGNDRSNDMWMGGKKETRDVATMNPKDREEYIRSKYEQRALIADCDRLDRDGHYAFLLAARHGDYLGVMRGLVGGVDVNLTITTDPDVDPSTSGHDVVPLATTASPSKAIPVNAIIAASMGSAASHAQTCIADTTGGHIMVLKKLLHGDAEEGLVGTVVGQVLDMTALMLACRYGHVLCVELLLLSQAHLQFRNAQGLTARDVITMDEPARSEITHILTNSYEAKQY